MWAEQRRFVMRQMKDLGWGKTRMEDLIHNDIDSLFDILRENQTNTGQATNIGTMLNLAVISSTWTIISGTQSQPRFSKTVRLLNLKFKKKTSNSIYKTL